VIPAECVSAGADLLARKRHGSVAALDPDGTNIAGYCPLRQVYGSYEAGLAALRIGEDDAIALGFSWPVSGGDDGNAAAYVKAADEAWKRKIRAARGAT
jgi:hypothetical protein